MAPLKLTTLPRLVGSNGSSFKDFSIVFLLSDWLKLNHLKSRMECGFSDIFSRSTLAETIGVTNCAASFGAKNVQKTTFEVAEMILGPTEPTKMDSKSTTIIITLARDTKLENFTPHGSSFFCIGLKLMQFLPGLTRCDRVASYKLLLTV